MNYRSLLDQGYSNVFLKQSFNNMLSMPFSSFNDDSFSLYFGIRQINKDLIIQDI